MLPYPTYFLILLFIYVVACCLFIYYAFVLRKTYRETNKEFKKTLYLKLWYKEIAEKLYGKDHIDEKEKEFLKNYHL